MKYKDIQLLSAKERHDKLQETVDHLMKLRFAHAVSPIEHPMKIRKIRKTIAKLKTAQRAVSIMQSPER